VTLADHRRRSWKDISVLAALALSHRSAERRHGVLIKASRRNQGGAQTSADESWLDSDALEFANRPAASDARPVDLRSVEAVA